MHTFLAFLFHQSKGTYCIASVRKSTKVQHVPSKVCLWLVAIFATAATPISAKGSCSTAWRQRLFTGTIHSLCCLHCYSPILESERNQWNYAPQRHATVAVSITDWKWWLKYIDMYICVCLCVSCRGGGGHPGSMFSETFQHNHETRHEVCWEIRKHTQERKSNGS